MSKRIVLTEDQLKLMCGLAKENGHVFLKHMPDSSDFEAKAGSWKEYWMDADVHPWPVSSDPDNQYVGSHVVDIVSRKIYIYPRLNSENVRIIGHEDDLCFLASEDMLVPFDLKDANYTGPCNSPEEAVRLALQKLNFIN